MANEVNVNLFVMRHGQKGSEDNRATLTLLGQRQVEAATRAHLMDINFDLVFYSGLLRTLETTIRVLSNLDQYLTIIKNKTFGFEGADEEEFLRVYKKISKMCQVRNRLATVHDWLKLWPFATTMRRRFSDSMLAIALMLARKNPGQKMFNVLITSHSPCGELATPYPKTTGLLSEADIVCYSVSVTDGKAKIVRCEILPCPEVTLD